MNAKDPQRRAPTALGPDALFRRCDPDLLAFETTTELEERSEIIGQARAVEAVEFGVGMRQDGYNLFALGSARVAKQSVVQRLIAPRAARQPAPSDWCYVHDFQHPEKPRCLPLPPGVGISFGRDVTELVDELRTAIPAVFETKDYRARREAVDDACKDREAKAFGALAEKAGTKSLALLQSPVGLMIAPVKGDEIVGPDDFQKLPAPERERIERDVKALNAELQEIIRQVPGWERDHRQRIKALNQDVTMQVVGQLVATLREKYQELSGVLAFFDVLERQVVENVADFIERPEGVPVPGMSAPLSARAASPFRVYQVNVLVDHSATQTAPIVYEANPTYSNLIGWFEHLAYLGALVTDFSMIRPGALHRANGGYLIMDARRLLLQPYAWEALTRSLRSKEIRIEPLEQRLGFVSAGTLQPEPIPLDVKVVLLGERQLYYLLNALEPDFAELFKVAVDFDDEMGREPDDVRLYADLIATLARKEDLLPFHRTAVARVIEHSARLASDAERLSMHMSAVADVLREADYWARRAGAGVVQRDAVDQAIEAQLRRNDRLPQRLLEAVARRDILVDSDGAAVGQVNGLSVIDLGPLVFGHPSRITARVRLGRGEVVDIEREVELGGPIHSKGVLILAGFLGARYAADHPLSLSASLVFEQSYGGVEGDSASAAELCALLSALAEVPVKQSLAVTGSVNQYGQLQAIGAVNEKIEGFFDVCQMRGLTGEQGVIIPAANVKHLMLRADVVDAASAGRFHVYAVETIDEVLALLTGLAAGERDEAGQFPAGSVNARIEARMIALAEKRQAFGSSGKPEADS